MNKPSQFIDQIYNDNCLETMSRMPDDFVETVTERYTELYERITGENFQKADTSDIENRIEKSVLSFLKTL